MRYVNDGGTFREKYPIATVSLSEDQHSTLKEWAARRGFGSRRGPSPGGLLGELISRLWPAFQRIEFDPVKIPADPVIAEYQEPVEESVTDEEIVKDWMLRNLLHSGARDKIGVLRGMGKTSSVKVSPEVAHALERILAVRQSENDRTGTES